MKSPKSLLIILLITLVSTIIIACSQETSSEQETIKIGQVPYQHEWIPVHIIKNVAEDLGYQTEIVEADVGILFASVAKGEVDILPDIWLPTLHANYMAKYSEDEIETVGTMYEDATTGWAVPTYVEDVNTIADLKGKAELFQDRIVGIEAGAGMMLTSEETLETYGLDDYKLLGSSTQAMLGEVKRSTTKQEPVAFLAWRPHTMFKTFDIKMLEDPEGVWASDDVKIGANPELKNKAPEVYTFIKNFKISIDDVEEMLAKMSEEDAKVEDLTLEWIDDNQDKIDEWVE